MGLASKIAASGPRPGATSQGQYAPQSNHDQTQSSYGQGSTNPPYPVTQNAPNPAMSTRPGGYGSSQVSSNPYANQSPSRPSQSSYGALQQQQSTDYAQPQPQSYGSQSQSYGSPAPGQYTNPAQSGQGQYQGQSGQTSNQYSSGRYSQPNYPSNQSPIAQAPGQPQYGGRPGPAQQGGTSGVIRDNILRIVRENSLEVFYPQQRLSQVIQQAEAVDFRSLAAEWDIPMEIATDLAALALYDIVLYCDDSGSMRAEERGERIDDLKLILSRVSEVMTKFDADGIQVRFMNSDVQGNGIRTASEATQLVQQVRFSGITPLGTNLDRKIIQPLVMQQIRSRALQKPVLVIVITDGEPVGESRDLTRRVILDSSRYIAQQGFPGALRFQFAQVGKDMKAQAFLSELDNDAQIGGVIDATSYFELEAMEMEKKGVTLTPDLWLVKLCVGAIDSTYDTQDE